MADDDDVNDVDIDDDAGDDQDEKDEAPKVDPAVERAEAARKKAVSEAKAARAELAKLKQAGESDAQKAVREATESAGAASEARWKPIVVGAKAEAALTRAEALDPGAMAKLIDMDAITVEDDGKITGLDAEIKRLAKAHPQLFGKPASAGRPTPGQRTPVNPDGKKMSSAERIAASVDL